VSESLYVVKGRVLLSKGVIRRPPKDVPRTGAVTISSTDFGTLFTVSVEDVVCRQADFESASSAATPASGSLVYFFVPGDEPQGTPSRFDPYLRTFSENLRVGREYLLFIRKVPNQEEFLSAYELDAGITYYRTYEGDRGAIELPDAAHPEWEYAFITATVSAVTAFCEAVRAPDQETKIRNLNHLRESASPVFRQSIDAAIRTLSTRTPVNAPKER
jgi:hypothetical protein